MKIPYNISVGDTSDHDKIEANFRALESTFNSPISIISSSDSSAPNSTLYYSTTQSSLVWKDSSGVVHNLY